MFKAFGLISGVLTIASYFPYTIDIFAKRAKPERASWLIWSLTGGLAFFSQLSKGATQSLWFPGIDAIGCVFTFILSIRFGLGGLKKRDIISLVVVAGGLLAWYISNNAIFALFASVGLDTIGAILTSWKTFEDSSTETYAPWLLILAASFFSVLAVGKISWVLLLYPVCIFFSTLAILGAKFFGRKPVTMPELAKEYPLSTNDPVYPKPSMLGQPNWSSDPVQIGQSTTLSVPVEYSSVKIVSGEYVGVRDPGPGNGMAMSVNNGQLEAKVDASSIGIHPINIRAKDSNGVWSEFVSTVLSVLPLDNINSPKP
jgi:hypothetical protein